MARRVQSLSYGDSHPSISNIAAAPAPGSSLYEKLNTRWHERYLARFHVYRPRALGEHLVQAYQFTLWDGRAPEPTAFLVCGTPG